MTDLHSGHSEQQRSLGDYLAILRRRKLVVIVTAFLVTGLTVAFSLHQQRIYRASASVLLSRADLAANVTGTPLDPSLTEDPARYAATQASVARSGAVATVALANAKISNRSPGALLAESTVTPSPTADLLQFTVDDPDPVMAAQLVNAYAAAYADYKLRLDTTALTRARTQLKTQIAALRRQGAQATAQYKNLVNSEQQLHTMELLQSTDTVLNHPASGSQVKPTPKRDALLGLGFGIVLGVALAFLIEALDRRVRSEEAAEQMLGLPLLARLPDPSERVRSRFALSMIADPSSSHAEGIRRLATSIHFANLDPRAQVIMMTSALQREGKSTTVANLAVALARSGHRVALVDLDLRQPTLASLFGITQLTGTTDVVAQRIDVQKALVPIDLSRLDDGVPSAAGGKSSHGMLAVLPSGPLPATPGEFVASDAITTRVLAPLRQLFDYILVDSPPMCVVGDASTLSARVDAVIAVLRLGVVDRGAIRDLKRQLVASPAPAIGFVIAGVERTEAYGYSSSPKSSGEELPSSNGAGVDVPSGVGPAPG